MRKELVTESCFFLASFIACFINPFTYQVFTVDLIHGTSSLIRTYIVEWAPIDYGSLALNLLYIYSGTVFLMSASVLIKDWKKFFPNVIIAAIFFYLTLDSRRYLTIYTLSSLPIVLIFFKQIQEMLVPKLHKILSILALIIILPIFCYVLFIRLPSLGLLTFDWDSYCSNYLSIHCSEKLTSFLNKNTPQGKGFNVYNWGGYLIWRVPKLKTYIDTRMGTWEENGVYPFQDYIYIYTNDNWVQAFDKQNFSWAIVEPNTNVDNYLSSLTISGQWKEEYRDNSAVYYVRLK
jgi:hypothetical protein